MMNKIVSEIVDVLLSLPEGTELATSDVIKQLYGHEFLLAVYGVAEHVHRSGGGQVLIMEDMGESGLAALAEFRIFHIQ